MSGSSPRLVAVVVTHNRLAQIKLTLARLLDSPVDHVVVVDNRSNDGTQEWLRQVQDPRLHPIFHEHNRGGAGGFEAGMRAAVTTFDPDWIVVMDDDARPKLGALQAFLSRDFDGAGAVASAVYYPDGRVCEMNRPSLNPFWSGAVFLKTLLGQGRRGFHLSDRAYRGAGQTVDAASFVGLFISRKAISSVGYPDGALFLYGDDVIYTMKMTRAGFVIRFSPELEFEHDCSTFEGAARVYRPLWKVYYTYRNGLILYRVAAGWLFWPVLLVVIPKWLWNGRLYKADRGKYYVKLCCAIWDGVRGQTARPRKFMAKRNTS